MKFCFNVGVIETLTDWCLNDQSEFFSGSGRVYTAYDRRTGQIVAVKRMVFQSQPKKELLLTEIKVMQKYKHEVCFCVLLYII